MRQDAAKTFMQKWIDLLMFLIPHYVEEGKNQLVISVGCTGGKHRSVALSEALYSELINNGLTAVVSHRDIDRDSNRYSM